jgi:phospholipid/cholesterol/gamma-HCH transport system permease protein
VGGMTVSAVEIEKSDQTAHTVICRFQGRIEAERINPVWKAVAQEMETPGLHEVVLDFQKTTYVDSVGIAMLRTIERLCAGKNITLSTRNIPHEVEEFLHYIRSRSTKHREEPSSASPGAVSRIGAWSLEKIEESSALLRFVGDFVYAMAANFFHPKQLRLRETLYQVQIVGSEAMPLVFGLSFLMGIIMAFQAATTLSNFGSPIYVADIVTISTTREMAPLLTAVIIAGRSGAAFAAEIGTMKINEEIDALEVMGFDITRFLVLPRVLALMAAGPLLTLLANAAGILGGASVGLVVLKVSVVNYFAEANKILTGPDIYTGLVKGFAFASLIGLIGCFRGLRTGTAAESVGIQVTSAVVSGILLLIIADALLTAIFQIYAW